MVATAVTLGRLLDEVTAAVPARAALITDGDIVITYAELDEAVAACAAALAGCGTAAGDRVAILDRPGLLIVAGVLAAARLGASAALLLDSLGDAEVGALVQAAGCSPIGLAGDADAARLGAALGGRALTPNQALVRSRPGGGAGTAPSADAGRVDAGVVLFTGGTTGLPKVIPVSGSSLVQRLAAIRFELDADTAPVVRMISVPLVHVGGLVGILRNLLSGVTTVVLTRFDAGEWLRAAQRHRVNGAFLVPAMLGRILDHPDFAGTDLSALRSLAYGAAPAQPELVRRATGALPHVEFAQAFGQTETLGGFTALSAEDHRDPRRIGSLGRPLAGVEVRIVEPGAGADVAEGEVGELWVRATQTVVPGWTRTGDLVRRDADGYLWMEGRLGDRINRGGEKFSPIEVETALREHPAVADAAVAPIPDAELGERVGAAVMLRPGADASLDLPAVLRDHCRARLAYFKAPEVVVVVDELPVTAVGKVDRRRVTGLLTAARETHAARP